MLLRNNSKCKQDCNNGQIPEYISKFKIGEIVDMYLKGSG